MPLSAEKINEQVELLIDYIEALEWLAEVGDLAILVGKDEVEIHGMSALASLTLTLFDAANRAEKLCAKVHALEREATGC